VCIQCSNSRSNSCASGVCMCGGGPQCGLGARCTSGVCVCDTGSCSCCSSGDGGYCPNGCYNG
jgi:hypothetical protein